MDWNESWVTVGTRLRDEDEGSSGAGWKGPVREVEEVVTKSQVGSGRGLHDRAGDEGVRLA